MLFFYKLIYGEFFHPSLDDLMALSALVPWNLPYLENFWFRICTQVIFFAKPCILNVWQCSEYAPVLKTSHYFLYQPYAMHCIKHIHNFGILELCVLKHGKAFWILRYIHTYWSIIKTYSDLFKHVKQPL